MMSNFNDSEHDVVKYNYCNEKAIIGNKKMKNSTHVQYSHFESNVYSTKLLKAEQQIDLFIKMDQSKKL